MQHETLFVFANQRVHDLFILTGAERGHNQRLGFTACEQGRTVCARQNSDFRDNRTNGFSVAAIDTGAFLQDTATNHSGFQLEEGVADSFLGYGFRREFSDGFLTNRADVKRAVEQAHARGLKVFLVPHLWVEWTKPGDWRALIDPKTDEGWVRYAASYGQFLKAWAEVAEETHVDLFAAGVEMRSWVTTKRAPLFSRLVTDLRRVYHGPITLSANWDDAEDTVVWGDLDVIGINAFYPLTDRKGAPFKELLAGAEKVRDKVQALHATWQKPVLFTEIGYTTRRDPALHPWEWPDAMKGVVVDDVAERAQADATAALLAPLFDAPGWLGFFVWRVYADPNDVSQEPPFGFSPRGKRAEKVVRDAFSALDRARTPRFLPPRRCVACGPD